MVANSSAHLVNPHPVSGIVPLSIALIGPNAILRSAVAIELNDSGGNEVREFFTYPPRLDGVPKMLAEHFDAVIVELDSDPELALKLVERIGANDRASVMVLSRRADPELRLQCMRAGASDFLTYPFPTGFITDALTQVAMRRPTPVNAKKVAGKLLAVAGSKCDAGATMLACNLAAALAQEKTKKTLLVDLDLPLGDAALNLSVVSELSTIDALHASEELDGPLLSQLLIKHGTGIWLLAAPGRFVRHKASDQSVGRLIQVARQEFDYVVLDLGSNRDLIGTDVYREATMVYFVTQPNSPELRDSSQLIGRPLSGPTPKLEIVINRLEPHALKTPDEHINKWLNRPVQWKIPSDFASVRKMQMGATPLVLENSEIAQKINEIASSLTGQQVGSSDQLKTNLPIAPESGAALTAAKASENHRPVFVNRDLMNLAHSVFLSGNGKAPHEVVFCGVDKTNGSSEICLQLGRILASHSSRPVCLIDADLHLSRLTRLISANLGAPIHFPERECGAPIGENLWLASNRILDSIQPGALAPTDFLKQRIAELRKSFEWILIDASGVNAGADAAILGEIAGAAILVIEANSTRRAAALKAKQAMEAMNVRILGCVLNNRTFPIPEKIYNAL